MKGVSEQEKRGNGKAKKKKKKSTKSIKAFLCSSTKSEPFPIQLDFEECKNLQFPSPFNSSKSQFLASPPSPLTLMPRPPPPHINPHSPLPSNPHFPFPTPPPHPNTVVMLPSPISTPPKNPPALHLPFPPSNKKKSAIPSISRFPRTFWDFWEKGGVVELCGSWG